MKVCTKCFEEKPLTAFYRKVKNGHARQASCIDCDKGYTARMTKLRLKKLHDKKLADSRYGDSE